MSKIITRLLPLVLALHFVCGSAGAQQSTRAPGLNLGDAVVTGFSGTSIPAQPLPANKSAIDLTFINPDGPSARIVAVGRPGYLWDGRLFQAPKTFDVFAKEVGQVFGVALDDQPAPNIYLAATSAFGLHLVGRGRDGVAERRKVGGPGTGWMTGQFGLELQGDPGSIYKVDGTTGVVSLFAKVMLGGVANPGPALGNLAYDAAHKQLFASDRHTGMIHRVAIGDGSEPGLPYDHGSTGRPAANLAPVSFTSANRPNIANPRFNSENPDTWGLAPPAREVWGLAVLESRLYYAARSGQAVNGAQIFSINIQQDGSFGADARFELDVAGEPYPVSDIAFTQRGEMILAQRAPVAGAYDYSAFTAPGEPRVLRYALKGPNDPPSPGRWKPAAEEYAIGYAGDYRNANGGVALGYGYGPDGTLSAGACGVTLWSTAQNLRNNPALRSQLEPGGPLVVHGLQGSPVEMVRGANEPPATAYYIDYDDRFDDPRASGHVGSVRIFAQPCAGVAGAVAGGPGSAAGPSNAGGGPDLPPGGCIGPNCPQPPKPKFSVSKKCDMCKAGQSCKCHITITGTGGGYWPGTFQFTESLSQAGGGAATITAVSSSDPWTCTPNPVTPGPLTCSINGMALASSGNSSVIDITLSIPADAKDVQNCAAIDPAAADKPDAAKACTGVGGGVKVVKTGPGACNPGDICPFTITITNLSSTSPFNGNATISDNTGSTPMTVLSVAPPLCPTQPNSMPFTCVASLSLPAGGSQTFTIMAMVPLGSVPLTSSISAKNCLGVGSPPPTGGGPPGGGIPPDEMVSEGCNTFISCGFNCHMTDSQVSNLKIEKKPNTTVCSPGGLCSYSVTVTNTSSSPVGYPITFNEALPAGAATFVSAGPLPWTCFPPAPGQVKCKYPPALPSLGVPPLAPGATLTVVITFQIAPGYAASELKDCVEFNDNHPSLGARARPSAGPALKAGASAAAARSELVRYLASRGVPGNSPASQAMVAASMAAAAPVPVAAPGDRKDCATVTISQTSEPVPAVPETCPPGMIRNPVTGLCTCPPGTVPRGRECVKQDTCLPPMIPGPIAGQCICPPGTVQRGRECVKQDICPPPKVPGPVPGQCVCPPGTMQKGRECVKPPICRPPMVPGPVPGVCVCPQGMVQQGRRCVPRVVDCRRPQVPNAAGTACVCPAGTVQRGRACEQQQKACNPPARLNRRGECELPRRPGIGSVPGGGPRDNPGGPRDPRDPRGPRGQGQGESPGRR